MPVRLLLVAIAAALSLSPAAWAVPAARNTDAATASDQDNSSTESRAGRVRDPDRRRCVYTTTVGSRLSRRVCRTNAEWEEIENAARRQSAERGGAGPGFRCDGSPDMCNGSGRTTVDAGTGRALGGGQ